MRTKLLRGKEDVTVQLVYPSTVDEYRQALDVLGRPVDADSAPADSEAAHAAYVVTTAQQRDLWGLPDLAVSGRAVPVDEARALDLLHDAALNADMAAELFPGRSPEVVSVLEARTPGGSWFDAVRGFLSPGVRVDQAVSALDGAWPSQCRSRGALGRIDQSVSARRQARRGGVGPDSGASRPAVGEVRVPAVRHPTHRAGSAPHPRRPRRRSGPHPSVPGVVSRGARPAHLRGAVLLPSRGSGRLARPRRSSGDGLRFGPLASALPVPGGPARRRWRTRSRRPSAGSS